MRGPLTKGTTITLNDPQRDERLAMFRRAGALLDGHFRLSSGLHSTGYLQCALVLQDPRDAAVLGEALAAKVKALGAGVVLSPALGGVIIGHEVARALGVRALFAERSTPPNAALTLRRGFSLAPGERVLVVEDVLTTGGSTRETIEVARASGGHVVGAAAIVNRSGGEVDLGVPLHALLDISLPTYDPAACPLCAQGVPVVKPGSRPT
jgi:orotate phosphoribosyltransferase